MFEINQLIKVSITALIHVLVVVYLNFKGMKRPLSYSVIFFLLMTVSGYLLNTYIKNTSVIFIIALVLFTFYAFLIFRLNLLESLALTLIGTFILLIGDLLAQFLFVYVLKYEIEQLNNISSMLIANFIIFLITILIIMIKQYIQRKRSKSMISTKSLFFVCVIFIIIISTINIFFYSQIVSIDPTKVIMFNLIAFSIYFIICVFLVSIYFSSIRQKALMEQQTNEYERLIAYTAIIESLYASIRAQKHDYMNVLFSIKGYIDNGKYDDLKEYFYSSVVKEYEEEQPMHFISSINLIQNSGLKGILVYKLNQAVSMGIHIYMNLFKEIEICGIDTIDLCKVIGILVDNAIEASLESFQKELHIGIESDELQISIIIANSYLNEPNLSQISRRGYSSKGKNRGLGLFNVKNILSRYPAIQLKTTLENNLLFQELIILK